MKKLLLVLGLGVILTSCEKESLADALTGGSVEETFTIEEDSETMYQYGDIILTVITIKSLGDSINMVESYIVDDNKTHLPLLSVDDTSSNDLIYNKYLLRLNQKLDIEKTSNIWKVFKCSRLEYVSEDGLSSLVMVYLPMYSLVPLGSDIVWLNISNESWKWNEYYRTTTSESPLVLGCTHKDLYTNTLKVGVQGEMDINNWINNFGFN